MFEKIKSDSYLASVFVGGVIASAKSLADVLKDVHRDCRRYNVNVTGCVVQHGDWECFCTIGKK